MTPPHSVLAADSRLCSGVSGQAAESEAGFVLHTLPQGREGCTGRRSEAGKGKRVKGGCSLRRSPASASFPGRGPDGALQCTLRLTVLPRDTRRPGYCTPISGSQWPSPVGVVSCHEPMTVLQRRPWKQDLVQEVAENRGSDRNANSFCSSAPWSPLVTI